MEEEPKPQGETNTFTSIYSCPVPSFFPSVVTKYEYPGETLQRYFYLKLESHNPTNCEDELATPDALNYGIMTFLRFCGPILDNYSITSPNGVPIGNVYCTDASVIPTRIPADAPRLTLTSVDAGVTRVMTINDTMFCSSATLFICLVKQNFMNSFESTECISGMFKIPMCRVVQKSGARIIAQIPIPYCEAKEAVKIPDVVIPPDHYLAYFIHYTSQWPAIQRLAVENWSIPVADLYITSTLEFKCSLSIDNKFD